MTCCNVLTGAALFVPVLVPDAPKPLVPLPNVKDRVCPLVENAGGDVPEAFRVDVSGTKGVMTLEFFTYGVPDRVRVFIDDVMVFDTGCVSTTENVRYEDIIAQDERYIDHKLPTTPHSRVVEARSGKIVGKIFVENNHYALVEVLSNCVYDMNITARKGTAWKVSLQCADDSLIDYSADDPFAGVYHIGKAKMSDGSVVDTGRQLNWTNPTKEV